MLGKSKCLSNHSSHSSHWTWPDNGYLSHFSHNSQVIKKQRTLLKVHLHGLPKEMEHILMFYSLIFRFPTFPTHLGVENPNLSFDKVTVQKPAVPSWRVNQESQGLKHCTANTMGPSRLQLSHQNHCSMLFIYPPNIWCHCMVSIIVHSFWSIPMLL